MISGFFRACIAISSLFVVTAFSQNLNTTSDSRALTIVQQAIAQMGGQAAWAKVADLGIEGSCSSQNSDGASTDSSQIHWVQAGNEFRYDATVSGQTTTFVSGHGKPAHTDGQNVSAWSRASSEAQKPYFAPALVLFQELNSGQYVLEFLGSTALPGSTKSVIHVRIVRLVDKRPRWQATQDWYFDTLTSLPTAVQYSAPGESSSGAQAQVTMEFSGFQASQGIVIPYAFTVDISSVASSACIVTSAAVNTSPPSSNFDLVVTEAAQ